MRFNTRLTKEQSNFLQPHVGSTKSRTVVLSHVDPEEEKWELEGVKLLHTQPALLHAFTVPWSSVADCYRHVWRLGKPLHLPLHLLSAPTLCNESYIPSSHVASCAPLNWATVTRNGEVAQRLFVHENDSMSVGLSLSLSVCFRDLHSGNSGTKTFLYSKRAKKEQQETNKRNMLLSDCVAWLLAAHWNTSLSFYDITIAQKLVRKHFHTEYVQLLPFCRLPHWPPKCWTTGDWWKDRSLDRHSTVASATVCDTQRWLRKIQCLSQWGTNHHWDGFCLTGFMTSKSY